MENTKQINEIDWDAERFMQALVVFSWMGSEVYRKTLWPIAQFRDKSGMRRVPTLSINISERCDEVSHGNKQTVTFPVPGP
jgi:hypothetical protein